MKVVGHVGGCPHYPRMNWSAARRRCPTKLLLSAMKLEPFDPSLSAKAFWSSYECSFKDTARRPPATTKSQELPFSEA